MRTSFSLIKNIYIVVTLCICSFSCGSNVTTHVHSSYKNNEVLTGLDILVNDNFSQLLGKNIGLITNHTGVNKNFKQNVELFVNSHNVNLVSIFTPEHGLYGTSPAGKKISSGKRYLDIPIYSLYTENKKPNKEMLSNIDILVYDIQDVGIRSYTYISTLGLAMESAAEHELDFIVLDRPNPLGLQKIEGNVLDTTFRSFIGMYPIPYVYGLTCGELATMINESGWLDSKKCRLSIIKMKNISRTADSKFLFNNWIPTSPHVPNVDTPQYMVATGVLGELNVFSIGVGYTLPFRTIAAPWMDSNLICNELNNFNIPGVTFTPITYKPFYGKYKDAIVNGAQIHITDLETANLILIQFYFLQAHNKLYPNKNPFKIASIEHIDMFNKALGSNNISKISLKEFKFADVENYLKLGIDDFAKQAQEFYLYD